MAKNIEDRISYANEARQRAYENGDPLWHAVADLEVQRVLQLGRDVVEESYDSIPSERIPYVVEDEPTPLDAPIEFCAEWRCVTDDGRSEIYMGPLDCFNYRQVAS